MIMESHVDALPARPDTKKSYSDGYSDEKAGHDDEKSPVSHNRETDHEDKMEDYVIGDPFPVDPNAPAEEHQLTISTLVAGCALGAVVGASNIYLGLTTGFTFGPQLFGAIFGFAIIKPLSRFFTNNSVLPHWLWGGEFGPKENVCVQTAATSAGGLGILFVSGIPAMYRLGLLSFNPADDIGKLFALTIDVAYFGVGFVIPLRKYFVIHRRLVFPTPSATAFTIRSLHSGKAGAIAARKKSLCLLITLLTALAYKVATGYAPGVLFDWHIGWTLYRLGWTSIIALENYGWYLEFTPAFFGAGMLSGLNASWSFLGGSILAWGIIAPALIATGKAVAVDISDEFPLKSMQAMKFKTFDDYLYAPSPRYWLLWPGVLIMLVFSFVELGMSSGSLIRAAGGVRTTIRNRVERYRNRNDPNAVYVDKDDNDPCPPEDRVPNYAWIGAIALSML
ncbi:hypothetical protein FRC05_008783 [Tulasnella sp. 425]|nr:hypothetical protein FRC05_008783 [Tulasnella sp. 425]